jgi:DNA (cytosine-5)-methyltransferase 1
MSDLVHVSLFSGVGGIDLAADRVGIPTVLACEVDKHARGVLHDRFPTTTLHADVTELTADDLRAAGAVPGRTIVSAGWPCQGNSVAGRREGMADARSGLWSHVVRLLADFRPAWFLGENVPGLLSVNDGRDFGVVLGDLANLGYGFAWRVLDAQHFGVPQRRRRVVLVGRAGDDGRAPARVLLEPEGSGRDSQAGNEARQDTPAHAARSARGARIVRTLTTRAGSTFDDQQTDQLVVSSLTAAQGGPDDAQAGHLVPCRGTPIISTTTAVRRLTPLECERLQGWPDNHTATSWGKPQADSQRYKQAGNGVATPVFVWVLRRIVEQHASLSEMTR